MAEITVQPNLLQRAVRGIASTALGARLLVPFAHRADRAALHLSGGRTTAVGLLAGLPLVWLTTTGAKSGQKRRVPLVGIPDGDTIVLVASNFGQGHHPGWYHNLRAHPQASVSIGSSDATYVAHEAAGAEYDRLWQKAVALYGGYAAYKTRTGGRQIPIMVLQRQGGRSPQEDSSIQTPTPTDTPTER
jgi:deazaflavin-dependent oxidoreductase (nitroreductase family)